MDNLLVLLTSLRGEMKKSRFKIWMRAFLFIQFSVLFSYYFFHDIEQGYFHWEWVGVIFLAFVPAGLLLSFMVPIQAQRELRSITFSLDRFYLFLIWFLVIIKLLLARNPSFTPEADFIMAAILGIMFGRLGGIGLRVRRLKLQHGWV